MNEREKRQHQPAYILHSYPYRETSLVVEAFTRDAGRIALVARGARRPKSALRGVLLAFQPVNLSWFGKSELRTLHSAEWHGGQARLHGLALMCGFYMNELTLRLMARDDPHERLFAHYREGLQRLAGVEQPAVALRLFERDLLRELGYAMLLEREAKSGEPVRAEYEYVYEIESGPQRAGSNTPPVNRLRGQTLLDLAAGQLSDPQTLQQSKLLLRMLINYHLAGQSLNTRQLLRDLQQL